MKIYHKLVAWTKNIVLANWSCFSLVTWYDKPHLYHVKTFIFIYGLFETVFKERNTKIQNVITTLIIITDVYKFYIQDRACHTLENISLRYEHKEKREIWGETHNKKKYCVANFELTFWHHFLFFILLAIKIAFWTFLYIC